MRVLENIEVSLAGCENSLLLLFAQNHAPFSVRRGRVLHQQKKRAWARGMVAPDSNHDTINTGPLQRWCYHNLIFYITKGQPRQEWVLQI